MYKSLLAGAAFAAAVGLAQGQSSVRLCGHAEGASSDCRPVNSGELFIAIAPFTFFPFLIIWAITCYCCLKEQDVDMSRCTRIFRPTPSPPASATPSAEANVGGVELPNAQHMNPIITQRSPASAETAVRIDGGASSEGWDCPTCTLHNNASATECTACETKKP